MHGRRRGIVRVPGVTLTELLVVVGIIAILLAILIPVTYRARELGQRAVCLSNLRQLTTAWIAYADQHDSNLVLGSAFGESGLLFAGGVRVPRHKSWAGYAFFFPESRSALVQNPDKGALWPYVQDVDVYRCPRGRRAHALTYAIVPACNGLSIVEGTAAPHTAKNSKLIPSGVRERRTVLRLAQLTDIDHPGAAERAVFLDSGQTNSTFHIPYLYPKWEVPSPPPTQHAQGVTLSMADGHAEYWKWRGSETAEMPRIVVDILRDREDVFREVLSEDYQPKTEEGLYDLQKLQRATWGRLGYPVDDVPSEGRR
jgi:prepilin-type N-terminal cleavage/methylation domain-containing protein